MKLVNITPIKLWFMVLITIFTGANLNQLASLGGPHCRRLQLRKSRTEAAAPAAQRPFRRPDLAVSAAVPEAKCTADVAVQYGDLGQDLADCPCRLGGLKMTELSP